MALASTNWHAFAMFGIVQTIIQWTVWVGSLALVGHGCEPMLRVMVADRFIPVHEELWTAVLCSSMHHIGESLTHRSGPSLLPIPCVLINSKHSVSRAIHSPVQQ